MSNIYFEKRNAIKASHKIDVINTTSDLEALDNKPFYSRRQIRHMEKQGWMLAACAFALGYLIAETVHYL